MQFLCKAGAFMGMHNKHCQQMQLHRHELHETFINHVEEFGIQIGTQEEFHFRFNIFRDKDAEIKEWNTSQNSFRLGHNMFSTMTKDEAKKMLGTFEQKEGRKEPKILDDVSLPASVDWRTAGGVNPVKNQGHCGSCWAFSATVAVEWAHWHATGNLLNLAEQQVVSCDTACYGCSGGWQYKAFTYLEHATQALTADYPYTSGMTGQTGSCNTAEASGTVKVNSYQNVEGYSVSQLKAAIAQGVTSVTIEADKSVFQQYHSGILNTSACGTNLDHAVAAVGYGSDNGQEYYIVRNSWSASWGDQGYIKIAAVDGAGICGIQKESLYPETN